MHLDAESRTIAHGAWNVMDKRFDWTLCGMHSSGDFVSKRSFAYKMLVKKGLFILWVRNCSTNFELSLKNNDHVIM